jgi:anti-sigma regulatory factor (Ser/Thr protein kinase)
MERTIILHLPLCTNNLLCARLTTSAVCSLLNVNIEEAEDIKVCVNEACLMFMRFSYKTAKLSFIMDNPLVIRIEAEGKCDKNSFKDGNEELGLTLLNSLLDEARYEHSDGILTGITLCKRI